MPFLVFLLSIDRKNHKIGYLPSIEANFVFSDPRKLVEWIGRQTGSVTARTVRQWCRWLRGPGLAEAALQGLVAAGLGNWAETSPRTSGGRTTRVFTLNSETTCDATVLSPTIPGVP